MGTRPVAPNLVFLSLQTFIWDLGHGPIGPGLPTAPRGLSEQPCPPSLLFSGTNILLFLS